MSGDGVGTVATVGIDHTLPEESEPSAECMLLFAVQSHHIWSLQTLSTCCASKHC